MTQQPIQYAPQAPQYPQAPPQQYAPPFYAPAPVAYPPQGYAPAPVAGPPPVTGTIDDYYDQPTQSGGPGISWKDKPLGTSYIGAVTRDVTNGDIVQDSDFTTKQPKFYKDGRPVFVMKVSLLNAPTAEFPDGEFSFWVRGQARDELARAMAEVGASGAPKAGDVIQVTLVQRKPSRMGNPANIVQIVYTPNPNGAQPVPVAASLAPEPVQAPPVQQYVQPVAPVAPPVQQYVQPVAPVAPVQQVAPPATVTAPVVQVPVEQPQALATPAGFSPEQAALLADLQAKAAGQQG